MEILFRVVVSFQGVVFIVDGLKEAFPNLNLNDICILTHMHVYLDFYSVCNLFLCVAYVKICYRWQCA